MPACVVPWATDAAGRGSRLCAGPGQPSDPTRGGGGVVSPKPLAASAARTAGRIDVAASRCQDGGAAESRGNSRPVSASRRLEGSVFGPRNFRNRTEMSFRASHVGRVPHWGTRFHVPGGGGARCMRRRPGPHCSRPRDKVRWQLLAGEDTQRLGGRLPTGKPDRANIGRYSPNTPATHPDRRLGSRVEPLGSVVFRPLLSRPGLRHGAGLRGVKGFSGESSTPGSANRREQGSASAG